MRVTALLSPWDLPFTLARDTRHIGQVCALRAASAAKTTWVRSKVYCNRQLRIGLFALLSFASSTILISFIRAQSFDIFYINKSRIFSRYSQATCSNEQDSSRNNRYTKHARLLHALDTCSPCQWTTGRLFICIYQILLNLYV